MSPSSRPLPSSVARYLEKRKTPGSWIVEGTKRRDFKGTVVIPAFDEEDDLPATLESLSKNPPKFLEWTLVLVVVNHREDAEEKPKSANLRTLLHLRSRTVDAKGLNLALVDAASAGRELPPKEGGVGLARKIGFDLALEHLEHGSPPPFLASLDADTIVDSNYLPALFRHFSIAEEGGAVIDFRHRPGTNVAQTAAIERYELFLRSYVLGLELAGSPYAWHTVGSAFACRADAYVRAGGMNRRTGGEDFYFIQQLAKTSGIAQVRGTTVHPSSRPSKRVPFGTGPTVARLIDGDEKAVLFYPVDVFRILGSWLNLANKNWQSTATEVLEMAGGISPDLTNYLSDLDFSAVWDRIHANRKGETSFTRAFNEWFDGLKTLRLIHHLCERVAPKIVAKKALPPLLSWTGIEVTDNIGKQLAILRDYQGEKLPASGETPEAGRAVSSR